MTGLDKMIDQILDEANNSANNKLEEAKLQVSQITEEAKKEAETVCAGVSQRSKTDIGNYKERMKSAADLRRRTSILHAKQELISQVIDKAYHTFCEKSESDYFRTIEEMLAKVALPQTGEIYFSAADLKRLPSGYEEKLKKIAVEKGGTLSLSKESRETKGGGFILAYGGIEENCSFRALFDAKRDELQDQVQKILFS